MSIRKTVPISEADWRIAPQPEWVETHEPDWEFIPQDGFPVAFMLLDEQHHVATRSISCRTVRQVLTHAAVQSLGQVELDFDPAAHRLKVHELAIWRKDEAGVWKSRSIARQDVFLIRQREQQLEQQMLNGRASVVALVEDLRVGDAIELSWTMEPRDALPGLRFTAFYAFAWTWPTARVFFTLHLDSQHPVSWKIHNPRGAPPPFQELTEQRATWKVELPALFVPEPNAPGDHWPFTLIDVSGWNTWSEVAGYLADLWAEALVDGKEAVAQEVERLRIHGDLSASVCAMIRFVQEDVRYLAVDFGHGGGMLPNGAGTVLRRRFGDCKDKAVLLSALLRALGLEAWPLLVATNWRKGVSNVQPSTAAFGHVVVSFISDGTPRIVDPTLLGQRGDIKTLVPPDYGVGLEVRKGASGLLNFPDLPKAELELVETFHLHRKRQDKGYVEQHFYATSWMADELRAVLIRGGRAAFIKGRAEALQKHFPALEPTEGGGELDDNPAQNILRLGVRHVLPTWGRRGEKPPDKFQYGAHGLFLAVEFIDGPEKRTQPWVLRYPMRVHHRVVVRGHCVRKVKRERHRFQGPGFRYSCDVIGSKHEVTFDYWWETTLPAIPPEKWGEYCKERSKALERAGANVPTPSFWSGFFLFGVVLSLSLPVI